MQLINGEQREELAATASDAAPKKAEVHLFIRKQTNSAPVPF